MSNNNNDMIPKLKFKYIFQKDYNAKYANGVYGGVAATGEIVANFYLERHALPKSQTHNITPLSGLSDVIETEPNDFQNSMVRVIENGIIITVPFAKALVNWLNDNIEKAEAMTTASQNKNLK